jgi:putative nucleotidyltransferase with HDIG domain
MKLLAGFHFQRVRTKTFLYIMSLITVISAFIFFYFPRRIERLALRDVSVRAAGLSEMLAFSLGHALDSNDTPALQEVLQKVKVNADLVYLVMFDEFGKQVSAYNRAEAERLKFASVDAEPPLLLGRRIFRTLAPVIYKTKSLGRVYMGFSLEDSFREMRKHQKALGVASLFIFLAGLFFASVVSTLMTHPLTSMSRIAEKIAGGDLNLRAKVGSNDEIGQLAGSFNTMVDSLRAAHKEVEDFNRVLEQKVEDRAQALEKEIADRRRAERDLRLIKEELENQVLKRTDELAKANQELRGKVLDTRRAEDQLQNTLFKLQKALEGTVKAMSLTIEMRDLYTAGHQRRVTNLAVAIGREMGLDQEQINGIRMAGVIHDIGKIAIPAEILSKPTRLSRNEFQLIKDHPRVGYDILKTIEFPWPVAQIVLQHHERVDGSGYPDGLVGDAILLEARIIAVADHVEAMSSHRPYRPALGLDKALEDIRRGRGIQFDARVVDACFRLFREKRFQLETDGTAWTA